MDLQALVGTVVGNYRLERLVGQGGMGAVFLARHSLLNTPAAIKFLSPEASDNTEMVARFEREARNAAALGHPNIVAVFDMGKKDGLLYMVMPFIEGRSLRDIVDEGPMAVGAAGLLMEKILDAVGYAHARSVLHRDLKPDNIIITPEGHPRITDFGLARNMSSDARLTSAGQVIGTPVYMPVEQWDAAELDARTDIYALGVTFYEMLVGQPPFPPNLQAGKLFRLIVAGGFDKPRQHNPAIPESIEKMCLRMMALIPEDRYETCDEAREELLMTLRTMEDALQDHERREVAAAELNNRTKWRSISDRAIPARTPADANSHPGHAHRPNVVPARPPRPSPSPLADEAESSAVAALGESAVVAVDLATPPPSAGSDSRTHTTKTPWESANKSAPPDDSAAAATEDVDFAANAEKVEAESTTATPPHADSETGAEAGTEANAEADAGATPSMMLNRVLRTFEHQMADVGTINAGLDFDFDEPEAEPADAKMAAAFADADARVTNKPDAAGGKTIDLLAPILDAAASTAPTALSASATPDEPAVDPLSRPADGQTLFSFGPSAGASAVLTPPPAGGGLLAFDAPSPSAAAEGRGSQSNSSLNLSGLDRLDDSDDSSALLIKSESELKTFKLPAEASPENRSASDSALDLSHFAELDEVDDDDIGTQLLRADSAKLAEFASPPPPPPPVAEGTTAKRRRPGMDDTGRRSRSASSISAAPAVPSDAEIPVADADIGALPGALADSDDAVELTESMLLMPGDDGPRAASSDASVEMAMADILRQMPAPPPPPLSPPLPPIPAAMPNLSRPDDDEFRPLVTVNLDDDSLTEILRAARSDAAAEMASARGAEAVAGNDDDDDDGDGFDAADLANALAADGAPPPSSASAPRSSSRPLPLPSAIPRRSSSVIPPAVAGSARASSRVTKSGHTAVPIPPPPTHAGHAPDSPSSPSAELGTRKGCFGLIVWIALPGLALLALLG